MYVGATSQSLKKRLQRHLSERYVSMTLCNNWKIARGNSVTIHLIEENINEQEIAKKEQHWIDFWKLVNLGLKNSKKRIVYGKKPEIDFASRKELNEKIKQSIVHRRKGIVVLNKDLSYNSEFQSVSDCSKFFKMKDETIIKIASDKQKSRNLIFIYKENYEETTDYSYKLFKKTFKSEISDKCRENNLKVLRQNCLIENIETGEVIEFESMTKCAEFLNVKMGSIFSAIERKSICQKRYYIHKDIVRSS